MAICEFRAISPFFFHAVVSVSEAVANERRRLVIIRDSATEIRINVRYLFYVCWCFLVAFFGAYDICYLGFFIAMLPMVYRVGGANEVLCRLVKVGSIIYVRSCYYASAVGERFLVFFQDCILFPMGNGLSFNTGGGLSIQKGHRDLYLGRSTCSVAPATDPGTHGRVRIFRNGGVSTDLSAWCVRAVNQECSSNFCQALGFLVDVSVLP